MTEAAKSVIELAEKLDNFKNHIGSVDAESHRIAFPDGDFSVFPLFYIADKVSGDIHDMEMEAIDIMFKDNTANAQKIKAIASVLASTSAWTNIFAFNVVVEASNNLELNASTVVPYLAEEIAWGMVNLSALDGALTMPFKNDILVYIKASLDEDGWAVPPLPLMFKNLTDLYEDQDAIKEVEEIFGGLSLVDIAKLESIDSFGIGNRPDMQNYLIRNQEVATEMLQKFQKLIFDWTTAINGE